MCKFFIFQLTDPDVTTDQMPCSIQISGDTWSLRSIGLNILSQQTRPSHHRCAFNLAYAMVVPEVFCLVACPI